MNGYNIALLRLILCLNMLPESERVCPGICMHLGWNIGKALGKRRSYTAEFIKKVFADTMKENEINTIIKKMSHSETECLIKLNPHIIQ